MGNRISEEKNCGNVLTLWQRFMVVYMWWIADSTWKRIQKQFTLMYPSSFWGLELKAFAYAFSQKAMIDISGISSA